MTDIFRIGKVTDTEQRELDVIADSGHVRLDVAGAIVFLPVVSARKLRSLIFEAIGEADRQAEEPEPGGATSTWEHHRHG